MLDFQLNVFQTLMTVVASAHESFYSIVVKVAQGNDISFEKYKGNVIYGISVLILLVIAKNQSYLMIFKKVMFFMCGFVYISDVVMEDIQNQIIVM